MMSLWQEFFALRYRGGESGETQATSRLHYIGGGGRPLVFFAIDQQKKARFLGEDDGDGVLNRQVRSL
jgi:hypothetical protein